MAKEKMTIEDLAAMINLGFDQTATKADVENLRGDLKGDIDNLRGELKGDMEKLAAKEELAGLRGEMRENFQNVYARLDTIRRDISDLPIIREELEDLKQRVHHLENKEKSAA